MEDKIVKLMSLYVKELYGYFDYDIDFNSDVTFIYGTNGCGKTTILNITEAIITGQLFKLFNYDFAQIELLYAPSTQEKEEYQTIRINKNKINLNVFFENENYIIEKGNVREEIRTVGRDSREVYRYYFGKYNFLEKIKRTFNYVYLPLNRSSVLYDYEGYNDYYMMVRVHNRIPLENDYNNGIENKDIAMTQIEALINYNYSRINSNISKLNDDFRNEILKSLLEVNHKYSMNDFIDSISKKKNIISDIQETKKAYIKILKELRIISKLEEEKYNMFFSKFINEFTDFQNNGFKKSPLELITKFQEISKFKSLVTIAEKIEQSKSLEREPIEVFLSTMNDFIRNSEDGKEIQIDTMGRVYFKTKYSTDPISIHYLSSGEKQLLTFFANLIFSVKNNTSGIFVVDEPELSLHLSWQKIFVEKTLKINENIQLIFATHSPEIIGSNRNKMYKLEKKYVEREQEDNE